MARPKKSIQEKVQKEYPEFVSTVDGASVADLEQKLSTYAKYQVDNENAQENDEELENAKALVKELSGPYNDTKKALKLKMKYIIALITEKGGNA